MTARYNYIDNIKGFLIILIVFSHFIADYINQSVYINLLYTFIFTFHIPLFVFISGYLSKNAEKQRDRALTNFLGLYLFVSVFSSFFSDLLYTLLSLSNHFSMAYLHQRIVYTIKGTLYSSFLATGPSWYLLSLIFWRLITPFFKRKRIIILSILIALLVGGVSQIGPAMSLSRTFVFYPFYLMGFFMDDTILSKLTKVNIPLKVIAIFILCCSLILLYYKPINYQMLYSYSSYLDNGYKLLSGIHIRSYFFALAIINSICFLWLIPKNKLIITNFGVKSLNIYIGHIFFIPIIEFFNHKTGKNVWNLFILFLLTICLCFLFKNIFFDRLLNSIKSIFNKLILRDKYAESNTKE